MRLIANHCLQRYYGANGKPKSKTTFHHKHFTDKPNETQRKNRVVTTLGGGSFWGKGGMI